MFSKFIQESNNTYNPVFYDVKILRDKENLIKILNSSPGITVLDEIDSQLRELIKLRHPKKKLTSEELKKLINNHLGNQRLEDYGVWIYYPWLNKVIHLLPEKEFIEVRTNRNHYKITPEEEDVLSKKKIGIIGLSVGKSIALTIALERICGELILADFDEIELSNLNRIQTGVQNFGVLKTVVVAREIAEIDPYLKVTCLHEGLTEDNSDDFFINNGKLDVCIEVCDGLFTKIFARQKAKEYGVAVVMNSSDRGTTDIERFDLNPELPILHGLIDHLDLTLLKEAKTNEEKVPYLLPMLGVETSSNRLKASMLEIEETITTWPQLASGVVFGGGICTDVCRRLLLGQIKNSGRYFVDIEDAINDNIEDYIEKEKNEEEFDNEEEFNKSKIDFSLTKEPSKKLNDRSQLTRNEVENIVRYAITAPSAGNTQPWNWTYKNKQLFLFHNSNKTNTYLNYRNRASLVGLGAACENVILIAQSMNYEVSFNQFKINKKSNLSAIFTFFKAKPNIEIDIEPKIHNYLVEYLLKRNTNRSLYLNKPISRSTRLELINVCSHSSEFSLKILSKNSELENLKTIVSEIDKAIFFNKNTHSDFMKELRWNKNEVLKKEGGISVNSFDLTESQRAGLVVSKKWDVVKYSKAWKLGSSFKKMSGDLISSSPAVCLLLLPSKSKCSELDIGRMIQRIWLESTKLGLSFQPMSGLTFLSERIQQDDFTGLEDIKDSIIKYHVELKKVFNVDLDMNDIFLFRIGYSDKSVEQSTRKNIDNVFHYEK